jgi:hypothetical protein
MPVEVSKGARRFLGNTDRENLRRRILPARDRDYPGREQEEIFLGLGMPGQLSALSAKVRGSNVVVGKDNVENVSWGYFVGPPESKGLAEAVAVAPCMTYEPLPSVWTGDDPALLERMLQFYPHQPPRHILDATVNRGRFWAGSRRAVVGLDIEPSHRPTVVGDCTAMPFADISFDVVVYDPPNLADYGSDRTKDFAQRFGLHQPRRDAAFLREAHRVLRQEGVLFAKTADHVHSHRFRWTHIELIRAAQAAGFTACDCIVKVRRGPNRGSPIKGIRRS